MAGVNIVHVPYKGAGLAVNDLIGGQVQMMFPVAASVAGHVKSGKLNALAVTSLEQSPLAPGLPAVAAAGLPGFQSEAILGVFAPAKTSAAIINRLNLEIVRFLRTAEAKERFFNAGVEVVGSTPAQFADKMKSEIGRLSKLIKDAGIRAE
jgi:tripartite-type tricarboxylate transporter receptor subunit TctC